MEDMCLRTPHILEQINELLDDKSLVKCKKASRIMNTIIEKQNCEKYLTIRMIQSYIKNSKEFADWRIIFQKLPMKQLNEFGILVTDFYKSFPPRIKYRSWLPINIAADRGHLEFCRFFAKVSVTKSYKVSLLLSAQAGHLEVSKFLHEEIEDKNSLRTNQFITAQHLAAKNGHLEIYKFLHEKTNDINPLVKEFITPLHLAAQYNHFDVCKYICDNTVFVGPRRSDGITPLSLAAHRGHIKIARLLIERDTTNQFRFEILCFILLICFLTPLIYLIYVCKEIHRKKQFELDSYDGAKLISNWLGNMVGYFVIFLTSAVFSPTSWNILSDLLFSCPKLEY